jgi:multidrug resistance efflux pump
LNLFGGRCKNTHIASARLQVEQAQPTLEQAEFVLYQARSVLDDAALLAPWHGTVLSIDVAPGGIVGAGTPILTLLDTGRLQFQTSNLSERDLADIEPGQEVRISLKTYPGQEISGTVVRIVPQASGAIGMAAP